MNRRTIFQLIVLGLTLMAGFWLVQNRQFARDWLVVQFYDPPLTISQLADKANLSSEGKFVFYASKPELNDKTNFNINCSFTDKTLVLGCYSNERIFIYEVADTRLDGIEEVTAAHELLHAVYARLTGQEKETVDKMVEESFNKIDNERIKETIKKYEADDPNSVPNELHSILGTEIENLPIELENHYAKYFTNRDEVIKISKSYEDIFVSIQDQIKDLSQKIDDVKSGINQTETNLASMKTKLNLEAERLNGLKNEGRFQEFNAGVPSYNEQIVEFNNLVDTYKTLIAKHNNLVEEYNKLAVEQNDLIQSLDSKYQSL